MLKRVEEHREAAAVPTQPAIARAPLLPVEVRGVTLRDGERRLLDRVTLRLEHGTRTVVMGANGAGKSLLLRVLHGLKTADEGLVMWNGKPADAAVRARQAMVFQKPVLLRRSARDNIAFVLDGMSRREALARADAILAGARLAHVAATPARLLSGGEQQRLAIARARALSPAILFLDEPTASLDPASVHAVEQMIGEAHAGGTKIVLVTHDLGQARRLADDIVFMAGGAVAEHTPAAEFFARPHSEAARAYVDGRIFIPACGPG